MAEDWAANVKKYVPDADDGAIAGIVRYCGIALQKRDSSLVSMGDPAETSRVRENFLKKKLGLTQSDADLDASIAEVGQRMKGENFKNRVTVYYLLAEKHGLLGTFLKPAATKGAAVAGGAAAVLGAAMEPSSAPVAAPAAMAPVPPPVAPAPAPVTPKVAPLAAATGAAALGSAALAADARETDRPATPTTYDREPLVTDTADSGGRGWLPWLLLGAGILALILLLSRCGHHDADDVAPMATDTAAASAMETPTGTAAPVVVPTGAGITSETRAGKPVLVTYFDTGKAAVAPAFAEATAPLKDYLKANAGSSLAVSGFTDATGNAAANAVLSKNRAAAVKAALVAAGIPEAAIAMVKPADTTGASGNNANGRRVEVTVK